MAILIKNAIVLTFQKEFCGDILLEGEKITAVDKNIDVNAEQIIDAEGMYAFPGGVDQHVHYSYSFQSASVRGYESSNAPLLGGTTTIIDFAKQLPGKDLLESVCKYQEEYAQGTAMCDYAFHAGICMTNDYLIAEIAKLPEIGVSSANIFMGYHNNPAYCRDEEVFKVLTETGKAGIITMIHGEDGQKVTTLAVESLKKGQTTPIYHAKAKPRVAELVAINKAIAISEKTGGPINISHISCREVLQAVISAASKGMYVLGETCPQYLVLDASYLAKPDFEGAKYVCTPPLRSIKDQNALWIAMENGSIYCIGTDHCAFDWQIQKHLGLQDFTQIPNGVPGVQDRLAILWTYGVKTGRISRKRFVELFATMPAKLNGMYPQKGDIAVGCDGDIVLFDPVWQGRMSVENSFHQIDYSLYEGMEQKGRVDKVFLRGQLVVEHGCYLGKAGQGKWIRTNPGSCVALFN